MMFVAGDVVKNRLNSKTATVVRVLENDMLRVRFDGATEVLVLHPSRFEKITMTQGELPKGPPAQAFKRGDYIQITDADGIERKGAALNDLGTMGYSAFDMLSDDGAYLSYNANYVKIEVLFRADIARGQMPKY